MAEKLYISCPECGYGLPYPGPDGSGDQECPRCGEDVPLEYIIEALAYDEDELEEQEKQSCKSHVTTNAS